jgi:hypothetical protein
MEQDSSCKVFEDQEDYIEDIHEQFRDAIRRYTLYSKMFAFKKDWKSSREELRKFLHYEIEASFSKMVIKESGDGIIVMRFDENHKRCNDHSH